MIPEVSPLFHPPDAEGDRARLRANILVANGAAPSEVEELLTYNENVFDHKSLTLVQSFPPLAEPHVAVWEEYAAEAEARGVFPALQGRLVQLQFPIQAGISETEAYRAATRRGVLTVGMAEATGLQLRCPEKLELRVYPSLAGKIPVLITGDRADFVSLVQALTSRNEPTPIPDSMGATMIAGFNNWDRIRRHRQQWEANQSGSVTETDWMAEFQRLAPQKWLYQDRLIILSDGFYSNVSASELGLSESEWRALSLTIRLEHECTHYFTRRLLNSMRNNLLDELIADYRGVVAAVGYYRADWFLRFVGLEAFPAYRQEGRLQNYRGKPPLSEGAFRILQRLVKAAAENLESFDRRYTNRSRTLEEQVVLLVALTTLTLEELASSSAISLIETATNQQQERFGWSDSSASVLASPDLHSRMKG